jgi:hypothetical protein
VFDLWDFVGLPCSAQHRKIVDGYSETGLSGAEVVLGLHSFVVLCFFLNRIERSVTRKVRYNFADLEVVSINRAWAV